MTVFQGPIFVHIVYFATITYLHSTTNVFNAHVSCTKVPKLEFRGVGRSCYTPPPATALHPAWIVTPGSTATVEDREVVPQEKRTGASCSPKSAPEKEIQAEFALPQPLPARAAPSVLQQPQRAPATENSPQLQGRSQLLVLGATRSLFFAISLDWNKIECILP